tara:strand:+ start:352 stop:708 length:357 start_codon:yes stop_codon:yes gene_type:complete
MSLVLFVRPARSEGGGVLKTLFLLGAAGVLKALRFGGVTGMGVTAELVSTLGGRIVVFSRPSLTMRERIFAIFLMLWACPSTIVFNTASFTFFPWGEPGAMPPKFIELLLLFILSMIA